MTVESWPLKALEGNNKAEKMSEDMFLSQRKELLVPFPFNPEA